MRKKIFVIVLIVFIGIVFFLFLGGDKKKPVKQTAPTPIPIPSDFDKNYSNFNYLSPGKSTYNDVVSINGKPKTSSAFGKKTKLTYLTPNQDYENLVVLDNNTVTYAYEYVFSTYRGVLSEYLKTYGNQLKLYSKDPDGFDWYIFLGSGIGVEAADNLVTRVLYFIPQDKNSFMTNIAKDVGLSETPIEEIGEPF